MSAERRARWWLRVVLAPRRRALRYGVALALALASLALARALHGLEGGDLSGLALASVVLSAIYGGLGPALLDTAVTALGIDYLISEPVGRVFDSCVLRVAVYGLVGYLIASIVASLREAYAHLDAERRETERAKQAREEVLAVVSHDLRSPLSSIRLNAEFMRRLPAEERAAQAPPAVEGILRSARQMGRLIDDLLDAVRLEKGQFRLELGQEDLAALADEALEDLQSAAQARAVRMAKEARRGDYALRCDGARIRQALDNLVDNAIKFSPDGGVVEVSLRASSAELAVAVKDSGPGIAEADLARVFDRYWQAGPMAHKGTGLGLFITRSIVEAHGGRIEVESRPGQGAAFTVHLPREGPTFAAR